MSDELKEELYKQQALGNHFILSFMNDQMLIEWSFDLAHHEVIGDLKGVHVIKLLKDMREVDEVSVIIKETPYNLQLSCLDPKPQTNTGTVNLDSFQYFMEEVMFQMGIKIINKKQLERTI